jgi:hypothetical protein
MVQLPVLQVAVVGKILVLPLNKPVWMAPRMVVLRYEYAEVRVPELGITCACCGGSSQSLVVCTVASREFGELTSCNGYVIEFCPRGPTASWKINIMPPTIASGLAETIYELSRIEKP